MIPSCDHTGVPGELALTHFHSSTTSGSACLISLRIRLKVSPRQSSSSVILLSISSDADRPSVEPDFFMFSSDDSQYRSPMATGRREGGWRYALLSPAFLMLRHGFRQSTP